MAATPSRAGWSVSPPSASSSPARATSWASSMCISRALATCWARPETFKEPSMNDRVTVDIQGGVADVRLVRADKMNALDDAMFAGLIETGERLKTEAGVRAVVLSGEGRAFCAGL